MTYLIWEGHEDALVSWYVAGSNIKLAALTAQEAPPAAVSLLGHRVTMYKKSTCLLVQNYFQFHWWGLRSSPKLVSTSVVPLPRPFLSSLERVGEIMGSTGGPRAPMMAIIVEA